MPPGGPPAKLNLLLQHLPKIEISEKAEKTWAFSPAAPTAGGWAGVGRAPEKNKKSKIQKRKFEIPPSLTALSQKGNYLEGKFPKKEI